MKSLKLQKPHLLVVVGLPGSGKSFFAKQFSTTFGMPYVDYAHYQQLTGSEDLGDVVATELVQHLAVTGQSILIEGRGESKLDRSVLAKLAHSVGYKLLFVWVQTEPQTTYKRAVATKDGGYSQSEYDARIKAFALLDRTDPFVVISGKHTFVSQARMVLKRIVTRETVVTHHPTIRHASEASQPPVSRPPVPPPSKRPGRMIMG